MLEQALVGGTCCSKSCLTHSLPGPSPDHPARLLVRTVGGMGRLCKGFACCTEPLQQAALSVDPP
jgi:hypothetical protein